MEESRCISVESPELAEFFKSNCDKIRQSFSSYTFTGDILDKKGISKVLRNIENLSTEVQVLSNQETNRRSTDLKHGAVFILEVEVKFENDELKVIEKVVCLFLKENFIVHQKYI